jgi:hypothetical protein
LIFTATWFSAMLYGSFLSLATFIPDEREAARAFLGHRAITPNQIFRTRVTVGLLVYSLGMLIPLALLAAYLAAIGPERLPVSPWQVAPAVALVAVGSIFYFAGILIACRSANWFGTRLFPLATAVAGSFLSICLLTGAPLYVTLPTYLLSCASALLMAFAARHAFVRLPAQVHPTRVRSESLEPDSEVLVSTGLNLARPLSNRPMRHRDSEYTVTAFKNLNQNGELCDDTSDSESCPATATRTQGRLAARSTPGPTVTATLTFGALPEAVPVAIPTEVTEQLEYY